MSNPGYCPSCEESGWACTCRAGHYTKQTTMTDTTLREEIATLILIHNNGIGTRELVEAEEGTDHQVERQAALDAADAILDYLRTKEATEEMIRRVIDKAFADAAATR